MNEQDFRRIAVIELKPRRAAAGFELDVFENDVAAVVRNLTAQNPNRIVSVGTLETFSGDDIARDLILLLTERVLADKAA
jgi:hypothetical protein